MKGELGSRSSDRRRWCPSGCLIAPLALAAAVGLSPLLSLGIQHRSLITAPSHEFSDCVLLSTLGPRDSSGMLTPWSRLGYASAVQVLPALPSAISWSSMDRCCWSALQRSAMFSYYLWYSEILSNYPSRCHHVMSNPGLLAVVASEF
jgi:hypothetical protein